MPFSRSGSEEVVLSIRRIRGTPDGTAPIPKRRRDDDVCNERSSRFTTTVNAVVSKFIPVPHHHRGSLSLTWKTFEGLTLPMKRSVTSHDPLFTAPDVSYRTSILSNVSVGGAGNYMALCVVAHQTLVKRAKNHSFNCSPHCIDPYRAESLTMIYMEERYGFP